MLTVILRLFQFVFGLPFLSPVRLDTETTGSASEQLVFEDPFEGLADGLEALEDIDDQDSGYDDYDGFGDD